MRRSIVILAVLAAAAIATAVGAQVPGETPYPSPRVVHVSIGAQTLTEPGSRLGDNVLTNFFPRGQTVVFRASAVVSKTGKVIRPADVKYFYVSIPDQPTLRFRYSPQSRTLDPSVQWPWVTTWRVPDNFPLGIVPFKVLIQTHQRHYGVFVQIPVATSQLTITSQ